MGEGVSLVAGVVSKGRNTRGARVERVWVGVDAGEAVAGQQVGYVGGDS